MAPEAELIAVVPATVLGRRIRAARTAAGLSQAALAGDLISPGHVSLIEKGLRRPSTEVIAAIAERTGTSVDVLLTGLTEDTRTRIRAELDLGELGLPTADPSRTLAVADHALSALADATCPALERSARRLRAAALEAAGDLPGAIEELLVVTAEAEPDVLWLRDLIALSRCHRESGQLDEAITAGEASLGLAASEGLGKTTEFVQLTVTVAGAHIFRGDLGRALRICKRAARDAEEWGLPVAKASALWNASLALQTRGDVVTALRLGHEALTTFEEHDDTRNLGRLRIHLANLALALDPPDHAAALHLLEAAAIELDWSTASPVDLARHRLSMATASFGLGEVGRAVDLLAQSESLAPPEAPELKAAHAALRGRLCAARGALAEARGHFEHGIRLISGSGSDHDAAQLWLDLGDILTALGEQEGAADAYHRAGASQGLRPLRR